MPEPCEQTRRLILVTQPYSATSPTSGPVVPRWALVSQVIRGGVCALQT